MFNILTLNKISKNGLDRLDGAKFTCSDSVENPDAVLVRSASMHETEFSEKTVAIARAGAGVNNIPIPVCSEKGIAVFNTPGANANAVKELVICSLFLASRKVAASLDWCKTLKGEGENVGKLVEKGKSNFAGPEILGKTLGIVGLGAIGTLVAQSAQALGMRVIAYSPNAASQKNVEAVTLDELFAQSDYITLHAPLNDSTREMVNAESIAKMKDGVRILNFARGELVASKDIIDALASGKAAAYVTDFPTDEQLGADGVTAIPHLGASTPESEENCAMMAADEVSAYLLRGEIKNSVNLPNTCLAESFTVRTCFIHRENADDFAVKAESAAKAAGAEVASIFTANKKDMGYTVIDTDKPFDASGVEGAIRVRVL